MTTSVCVVDGNRSAEVHASNLDLFRFGVHRVERVKLFDLIEKKEEFFFWLLMSMRLLTDCRKEIWRSFTVLSALSGIKSNLCEEFSFSLDT